MRSYSQGPCPILALSPNMNLDSIFYKHGGKASGRPPQGPRRLLLPTDPGTKLPKCPINPGGHSEFPFGQPILVVDRQRRAHLVPADVDVRMMPLFPGKTPDLVHTFHRGCKNANSTVHETGIPRLWKVAGNFRVWSEGRIAKPKKLPGSAQFVTCKRWKRPVLTGPNRHRNGQ